MKRSSICLVVLLVCAAVPAGPSGADIAPNSPARADPVIEPLDAHNMTATWDFYAAWGYCATAIELAPGSANLSTTQRPGTDEWSQRASLGAGAQRDDFSAAYDDVDGQVIVHGGRYLTGGMQDTDWYRPLMTYDPALNDWADRGASKLPAGNVGVWDGPDGAFLSHGGYKTYLDVLGQTVYEVQNGTWAWFPPTGTWSQRAGGPTLYHHAAVYDPDDGLMITFGGMNTVPSGNGTRDTYYNTIYVYNFTTDRWTQRIPGIISPAARAYHSAVWDNESGQMIIFGGYNGQSAMQDCWAYKYTQNTWTQLTSATPSRYMHAAAWDPARAVMIISAGRAGALNANDTLVFDPSANAWSTGTSLPASPRVLAPGAFDTQNGQMIVCGGGDGGGSDQRQDAWALRAGDPVLEYLQSGSVQAGAMDLGPAFHSIDKVSWDGDMPVGTSVSLRFRASNINVNASGFVETANGSKPTQQGRHLQWNLTLTSSTDAALSPLVRSVRVEYTLNQRPVASASGPGAGFKRTVIQLDGTATDQDGDVLTCLWTKLSGPPVTLGSPGSAVATFSPNASGIYVFTFVASDGLADSNASMVTVTVENRRPRSEAGPDREGGKGELMLLEGRGIDEDRDPLTYQWTLLSGPNATFDPSLQNLSFIPGRLGNYTFRLVVDDGEQTSAPAVVNATITGQAPAAGLSASPSTTHLNETVNFSAAGSSDPDGKVVARLFDFGDGNSTGWTSAETASHGYQRPGTFNATVTVRDDDGFLSEPSSRVMITVQNRPPVTGASVTPETGNTSTLFRFLVPKGSTYDPDGTIVDYFWDFGDGTNATSNTAVHTYRAKGDYEVVFRVTDNWGAMTEQVLEITVVNRPPEFGAAAPGQNTTMNTGLEQLFSADFSDPDNDELTYVWTVNGARQSENGSRFFFRPDQPGRYHITLTVSDGTGRSVHEWDVTARKRPVAVEETDWGPVMAVAAIAIIAAAVAATGVFLRRRRPKEEPVIVYAPAGYKPGDELPASGLAGGPATPAPAAMPGPHSPPARPAAPYSPQADASEPVAMAVVAARPAGGPAPMEAIPYAEPLAPSGGGPAMEAEPITEAETPAAAPAPAAPRPAAAPSRPPASYQPPPRSGLSPQEPYAKQMWRK